MYQEKEIYDLCAIEPLLHLCGLHLNGQTDLTIGIYDGSHLAATGSICGSMIQMVAVDPAYQGEGLAAKVISILLRSAYAENWLPLYLFTKPGAAEQFTSLGFRVVTDAAPYCVMLEYGSPGVREFCRSLSQYQKPGSHAGLVMNCNPFTLGHRYLIEQAAQHADHVYLFVVQEDRSEFSFADRLAMVQLGTADIPNVTVIPGGRYIISDLTFPNYFTKAEALASAHAHVDACVFRDHIAPALGITARFVGTEPLSPTTAIYNQELHSVLPPAGITVTELPRLEKNGRPISASRVRQLLRSEDDTKLRELIPETILNYLRSHRI